MKIAYAMICTLWMGTAVVQAQVCRGTSDCDALPVCASSGCDASCQTGCDCDSIGCASGTADCNTCSHYFSTFGGWTDWDIDANLSVGGGATGGASLGIDTKDGYALGGAIGRYLDFNCRSEFEFGYRNNSLGSATAMADLNNPNPILGGGNVAGSIQAALDGRIKVYSGMYNFYHDLKTGGGRLQPYVGGGIGFAFLNTTVSSPDLPGIALSTETSSFAYQGIAGFSLQWTDRVDLFTEYRVFGLDDFKASIGGPAAGASLKFDGLTHNVLMGARIAIR